MAEKAFAPPFVAENVNAQKQLDPTSFYPDPGVSYAKYSKTLLDAGAVRLNPQTFKRYLIANPAGFPPAYTQDFQAGKTFYCKQIILSLQSAGASVGQMSVLVQNQSVTENIMQLNLQASANGDWVTKTFEFPIPLDFGEGISIIFTSNGTSARYMNIFGWYE